MRSLGLWVTLWVSGAPVASVASRLPVITPVTVSLVCIGLTAGGWLDKV